MLHLFEPQFSHQLNGADNAFPAGRDAVACKELALGGPLNKPSARFTGRCEGRKREGWHSEGEPYASSPPSLFVPPKGWGSLICQGRLRSEVPLSYLPFPGLPLGRKAHSPSPCSWSRPSLCVDAAQPPCPPAWALALPHQRCPPLTPQSPFLSRISSQSTLSVVSSLASSDDSTPAPSLAALTYT